MSADPLAFAARRLIHWAFRPVMAADPVAVRVRDNG
jgi:hypothetical protein